jgi:hypothetical protein
MLELHSKEVECAHLFKLGLNKGWGSGIRTRQEEEIITYLIMTKSFIPSDEGLQFFSIEEYVFFRKKIGEKKS